MKHNKLSSKKEIKSYNQIMKIRAKALGVPVEAYKLLDAARYNKMIKDAIKNSR